MFSFLIFTKNEQNVLSLCARCKEKDWGWEEGLGEGSTHLEKPEEQKKEHDNGFSLFDT